MSTPRLVPYYTTTNEKVCAGKTDVVPNLGKLVFTEKKKNLSCAGQGTKNKTRKTTEEKKQEGRVRRSRGRAEEAGVHVVHKCVTRAMGRERTSERGAEMMSSRQVCGQAAVEASRRTPPSASRTSYRGRLRHASSSSPGGPPGGISDDIICV